MWASGHSSQMSEAYGDTLLDGVDLASHGEHSEQMRGRIPVHVHAWLILVLALAALWFIGGVVFKGVGI